MPNAKRLLLHLSSGDIITIKHLITLWDWCNHDVFFQYDRGRQAIKSMVDRLRHITQGTDYKFSDAVARYGGQTFNFIHMIYNLPIYELTHLDREFDWPKHHDDFIRYSAPSPCDLSNYPGVPWQCREEYRMVTRYKPVPWHRDLPPIPGHYVHLSEKQPGMVAYTPNEDKGRRDIQVVTRPGRYLTKFYPHLPAEEVRKYATMVDGIHKLKFAKTADEIVKVYLRGPRSCMSHDPDDYASYIHPVSVYGDSDLQVAYLEDYDKRVTDRVLVWPEKKIYGRVYGGGDGRLERMLREEGYIQGSLEGARIRLIEDENHDAVVMPYIDGCQSFDVIDNEWCRIGGPYPADRTDGLGYLKPRAVCVSCEECLEDYEVHRWDGEIYCASCLEEFTFLCDCCLDRHNDEDGITVNTDTSWGGYLISHTWCEDCARRHSFHCQGSGENFSHSRFEAVRLEDGRLWSNWYFERHGVEVDGRFYEQGQEPQEEDEDEYENSAGGAEEQLTIQFSG